MAQVCASCFVSPRHLRFSLCGTVVAQHIAQHRLARRRPALKARLTFERTHEFPMETLGHFTIQVPNRQSLCVAWMCALSCAVPEWCRRGICTDVCTHASARLYVLNASQRRCCVAHHGSRTRSIHPFECSRRQGYFCERGLPWYRPKTTIYGGRTLHGRANVRAQTVCAGIRRIVLPTKRS